MSDTDRNDPDYPGGIGRPVWDWGTPTSIANRHPPANSGRTLAFYAVVGIVAATSFLWVPLLIVAAMKLIGA